MPIYMKFEGIDGPVTGKFKGWIELQSCTFGASRYITSGVNATRESGHPSIGEVVMTKLPDSASQQLYRESLLGKGRKVSIAFVKTDNTEYMQIEIEMALIANYSFSGHGGNNRIGPLETISLDYSKITYKSVAPTPIDDQVAGRQKAMWQMAH